MSLLATILFSIFTFFHQQSGIEAITNGIESIPVFGTPGTMAVWGEHAFPVVVGNNRSQPVAVAATYGKGRFFAIAHGSYVGGVNIKNASPFMTNVIKWVGQNESPLIGVVRSGPESWTGFDVLMFSQNTQLSQDDEAKLLAWIAEGGGVVASACPWGWAQVTGKNLQTDLSQNRVMMKLGMQYGGNYARGKDGVFLIGDIPAEVHSGVALGKIASGEPLSSISSSALQYAVQLSPEFRTQVNAVIGSDNLKGPTKKSPVHTSDVKRRLYVTNFSSDWKSMEANTIEAASESDKYPGTVNPDVQRVNEGITLSPSSGWQSVGLYLCPGEILRMDVMEGNPHDWKIRIGCHKDTLWHKDQWVRWPEITSVQKVQQSNEIATPWGGLVYFESGREATPMTVYLSGVVPSPLYDIIEDVDWATERLHPAPWAEIKGRHMILSIPSSAVRELENPQEVAEFWDRVVSSHCELAGIEVPTRPERFVADIQISAGYMHSGYPIMTGVDVATPAPKKGKLARVVDVQDLTKRGSWGHFHELGHNRQRGWWTFSGTGEVTCNLFSLHAGEVLCGIEPWENAWLQGQKASGKKYLEDGADFAKWKSSPGIALISYAQVQREFGWEPFTTVFAEYEELQPHLRPKENQAKMDEWVRRISLATNHDLRPFYQMWGMPLSQSLLENTKLDMLEPWMPKPL